MSGWPLDEFTEPVDPPGRKCFGLDGAWCGEPSTHVAREPDGLERFCCPEHFGGAEVVTLAVWFEAVRLIALAHEAEEALRSY